MYANSVFLEDFDTAKALVDSCRVVSFDFFDTLVARTVEKPWHAFFIVEKIVAERTGCKRSFVPERRQAEAIARQRAWKEQAKIEVTLDEIYEALIDLGFNQNECQLYKAEEIAVEKTICYADPTNKKLYDYAVTAGKKIILVSDMYLPEDVIEDIAANCGYSVRYRTFVSSTYRECKWSEGLFSIVVRALRDDGVISQASDILHIGDNHHADIVLAAKWGMKTLYRPDLAERFQRNVLNAWDLADSFPEDDCPLTRSLFIGIFKRYWAENGARSIVELSVRDLGFYVVGPLLLGFALWMRNRCITEKVERLFFLARDGWIFKQAFEKVTQVMGDGIETVYVYASRCATYFPSLTELDGPANKFLVASYSVPPTVREYFDRIAIPIEPFADELIQLFGSLDACVPGFDFRLGHFFRRHVFPNIREKIERERALATAYMAQMNMLDGIVTVCDIGYFGSLQDGFARMARLAGHSVQFKGYYFATSDKNAYGRNEMTGWLFDGQKPRKNMESFFQSSNLMELFFTGLHGTVLGYRRAGNGIEPVLRPVSEEEEERFAFVKGIQQGAMHFIDMFFQSSQGSLTEVSTNSCLAPWQSFITDPPSVILNLLTNLKHNDGAGVSSYVSFLPLPPSWATIIRHPSRLLQTYRKAQWRAGYRAMLSHPKRYALDCILKHEDLAKKMEKTLGKILAVLHFGKKTS